MSRRDGQPPARLLLSTLLIIAAVGLLPATSLLHPPLDHASGTPDSQLAPASPGESVPAEDPVAGPAWAMGNAAATLWPPAAALPKARPTAFRHPGHLRRIDRPPRV